MHVLQRPCVKYVIPLIFCLTWPASDAGVFSVTPVRLYMTQRDRAIAVTLTNEGDAPIVLQADINTWSQKPDGTDELVLTEDLILAPPIIKLDPKARQVVRLALLKPADASRQLTYRMIIREVPEAQPAAGIEVPIALALSMPVFITPPAAKRQMDCTTARADAKAIDLRCTNTGTAYAQIREATVTRAGQSLARFEGGSYILPGASKTVSLKGEKTLPTGEAQLVITFDDGQSLTNSITLP
jgi:fimbrial chaperone protein